MTADWPADAVLDEIYPQSFADSDGDGVGDLRGVIEHLDHLGWLGVDTMWFNLCVPRTMPRRLIREFAVSRPTSRPGRLLHRLVPGGPEPEVRPTV